MNITDLLRSHAVDDHRFDRFNQLAPERWDYTLRVQKPDGETTILRNPGESPDGSLSDRRHSVPTGTRLLAAGTAFWEWTEKKQHTVGIDIDTDDNHGRGLTTQACAAALEAVRRVPWLEARRSSGGKGLHVFPKFNQPVEVASRKEGTALARAVLTLASREAAFDFKAAKDCAGGNMWIYKHDAPDNAYEVVKEATATLDIENLPAGWREFTIAKSAAIRFAPSTVELSAEHLEIERQLRELPYSLIYDQGHGCFHVHTCALQEAYRKHGYRGYFVTASRGMNPGEPNGFMFPLPGGAFLVKRFGNAKEDPTWFSSPKGQYAYLNVDLPFSRAVDLFTHNHTSKGYVFDRTSLELLIRATGVAMAVPACFEGRTFFLKFLKTSVQILVEKQEFDPQVENWTSAGKSWQRSFRIPPPSDAFLESSFVRVSDLVRAVATEVESTKWCLKTDGQWVGSSANEVKNVLLSECESPAYVMGGMRQRPYWLVYEPFRPEYLPGRRWNREAPQLACKPADDAMETPTWDAVFNHIGSGLNTDVEADESCQCRGIASGSHYLQLWVKLLIERPQQRSPYLFLTSRQNNTGKTSLGLSITHLINPGVGEINEEALVGQFTSELEGKVLCLIEELDLRDRRNKAYGTLKRVLTSKTLTIRRMRTDAYNVPNYTHFIHTANDARFVPCETEDMRIIMINVPQITNFIESETFEEGIKAEAPSMLRKLMDLPLPEPCGRFWLPVVQTSLKESVLTGLYENEVSHAAEGLKRFATSCLRRDDDGLAPQPEVLARYAKFCLCEGLRAVPKMEFLKVLRDAGNFKIDKKQKRIAGKQVWHYTGIALSC